MVANVDTENWQASLLANQGSDDWPVTFSAIRAADGPRVDELPSGGQIHVCLGPAHVTDWRQAAGWRTSATRVVVDQQAGVELGR